ncbi:MAG TPA: ATP-binding protein [Chloroflexia bacterium]|nr:ATP-binding protein [Chloroflexia bacterium]
MAEPLLLLVAGAPGSGKTTVANRLAQALNLPLLVKDGIKETLFETLGYSDLEWAGKLSLTTYNLLYFFLEIELRAGHSLIVESNFDRKLHESRMHELRQKYPFDIFQLYCRADDSTILERYSQRGETEGRHPGHLDHLRTEDLKLALEEGRYDPLELGGITRIVDTTDFTKIDYASLLDEIKAALSMAA